MTDRRELGRLGEESAASFLCGKGFKIVARNIHLSHSEIDIIAVNDKYIVFAEVKTRREYPGGHSALSRPAAAVNAAKQKKLIEGAHLFMKRYNAGSQYDGLQMRLDVLEVYASPDSESYKVLKITHMEGVTVR